MVAMAQIQPVLQRGQGAVHVGITPTTTVPALRPNGPLETFRPATVKNNLLSAGRMILQEEVPKVLLFLQTTL
jgi:hypothetical protein